MGLEKKMAEPTITNSVNVVESGTVQEIIGTSSDGYQLYIIRLTAENDGTKTEVFSVLASSEYKISNLPSALSPCVSDLKIKVRGKK